MKKKSEQALEKVKMLINESIDPRKMSVAEAREFLEELKGDLGMQIECLPQDEG